ncbi:MTH938/NDUFAF3 family protein [Streptomyces yangpuensis]|uniref:MTH938/NDUFAF3 family protein n=1 Tax=Streptomyces yangpuensis TaxID=1648182 RepID=UPI0035E04235
MTDTGTGRASDTAPASDPSFAYDRASDPAFAYDRASDPAFAYDPTSGPASDPASDLAAVPGASGGAEPLWDARELLERGARVVVLSLGRDERLAVAPPTLELLRQAGAEVHVKETRAAVALYNTLAAAGRPVGGLFHSTC